MPGRYKRHLDVAVAAAREAGVHQIRSLGGTRRIRFKGEINIVTEVDTLCEEKIIRRIRKAFPDHDLLTEEAGALKKPSEFRWVIDPLDGTVNYAHGYPLFCVSIALEHRGEVVLGVVFEPNRKELFTAVKGEGARLNGKKIRVSKEGSLKRSLLATGFAYNVLTEKDNNFNHFKHFITRSQAVRRDGVAAVDLCYVACGRFEGFWELDLWPWDVAAASLIVSEAGGQATLFAGRPLDIYGREICASNGKIHQAMLEVIRRGSASP